MSCVTLTTDFGIDSEGPGIMEAAIFEICPTIKVIHLCHSVSAFNIIEGARQMECAATIRYSAVHVGIVDPGVGSSRHVIVIELPGGIRLIGPDNGLLIPAMRRATGTIRAWKVENQRLVRQPVSSTFHGRDIFAAIAGHLAAGVPTHEVGSPIDLSELVPAPYCEARWSDNAMMACVIRINRFGNCILNVKDDQIFGPKNDCQSALVRRDTQILGRAFPHRAFSTAYHDLLLYPDSYGRTGLAFNQANAAQLLQLRVGDEIILEKEIQ